MLQRIIVFSYLLLVPLLMVQMSVRFSAEPADKSERFYTYSYAELYQFVFESMSDMAFVTDDMRDIFAEEFATKFKNQNISFSEMRREYILRRNCLGYINDLLFKLDITPNYYKDDYLAILFKDSESFYNIIGQEHEEYAQIFKLYEAVIKSDNLVEIDLLLDRVIGNMLGQELSSEKLVELGKIVLISGNTNLFFKIIKSLIKIQDSPFSNEGFEIESWHLLAHYYYYRSEPKLSLQYCNKLYDLFKREELFYPIAKQLDMFSEIMPFLTKVTSREDIFSKIVDKIFNHPEYQELTDPRLRALIYMNLSNASMQHLNPDYILDLGLTLDSFLSDQDELRKSYFVQESKYNIFNILVMQGDYYNLAIMLDEIEFEPILDNKNPLYGRLLQVRLLSDTRNITKDFDTELVAETESYLDLAYTESSPSYIQGQQLLIAYYAKYNMMDEVMRALAKVELVIMSGADNNAKIEFLMFSAQMLKDMPGQLDIIHQKTKYFLSHHYVTNKKLKKYLRYYFMDKESVIN